MEYLENQSRRNNIRVSGIPEEPRETWEKVEEKVKAAVKEKLDLDIDIERTHRVEKRKEAMIRTRPGLLSAISRAGRREKQF